MSFDSKSNLSSKSSPQFTKNRQIAASNIFIIDSYINKIFKYFDQLNGYTWVIFPLNRVHIVVALCLPN